MINIKNFTKIQNKKVIIRDLNLNINKGEIFGIIEAGKGCVDSLVKSMVGIENIDDGSIKIDDIDIEENPFYCKKVLAYISKRNEMYESLTGIQYLKFIGQVFRVNKEKFSHTILSYSKCLNIEDSLNEIIEDYSIDSKKKLAIIAAMIHKPKVMVIENIFNNLSEESINSIKKVLLDFIEEGGTIVITSNSFNGIEKLCHRAIMIKDGEIVEVINEDQLKDEKVLDELLEGAKTYGESRNCI